MLARMILAIQTSVLLSAVMAAAGCDGKSQSAIIDEDAPVNKASRSSQERSVTAVEVPDAEPVPDGNLHELFQFIDRLGARTPDGATDEERRESLRKIVLTQLQAAENILAQDLDIDQRVSALEVKVNALRTLSAVDPQRSGERFQPFLDELASSTSFQHRQLGEIAKAQCELDELVNHRVDDPLIVVDRIQTLIKSDGAGLRVLLTARDAARTLHGIGFQQHAADILSLAAEVFRNHADQDVVAQAATLGQESELVEFESKMLAVFTGQDGAVEELNRAIKAVLQQPELGQQELDLTSEVAQSLEFRNHLELAESIYEQISKAFAHHADTSIVRQATARRDLAKRRFNLLGRKLKLSGVLHDGSRLNWDKLRGKIVLVDFWSTDCQAYRTELPNIRRVYDQYRRRGFEVVGISLDEDPQQLRRFMKAERLSWPVVISEQPGSSGFGNPNAVRCGVEAIPLTLLVDRQGKVVTMHVLGDRLQQEVAKLVEADPQAASPLTRQRYRTHYVGFQSPAATAPNDQAASENEEQEEIDLDGLAKRNPYAPHGDLSPQQLIEFLFDMEEKPRSIQNREGFTAGVIEAADRILAADASPRFKTVALLAKLKFIHRTASLGNEKADEQLKQLTTQYQDDPRKQVQEELRFLILERRVLDCEQLPEAEMDKLFDDLKAFYQTHELNQRHLRIASSTVAAINRLDDGDRREELFAEFGKLWSKSKDRQLSHYGKRIAGGAPQADLVGKPIELQGQTVTGELFDWNSYRGKIVLIDFWATWCGPCLRAMPKLKQMKKDFDAGFDIVGISLDEDLDALEGYLAKNELPWTILAGDESRGLADTYGVRGIPTLILVNKEGKALAVTHNADEIASLLKKELAESKSEE